MSSHR
jgi:hypothetical protein